MTSTHRRTNSAVVAYSGAQKACLFHGSVAYYSSALLVTHHSAIHEMLVYNISKSASLPLEQFGLMKDESAILDE